MGCGGAPSSSPDPRAARLVGSIHTVAQTASGQTRPLSVEYAAAGLSAANPANPSDAGSMVIVEVFRDGRVDNDLDLTTLSINIPLSALPGTSGTLDANVDGSDLTVLLEGASNAETLLIAPEAVQGTVHLRYDAPPRPGITLRGEFSLFIEPAAGRPALKLEGEIEVPVLGS